jgi:hypothetical protein
MKSFIIISFISIILIKLITSALISSNNNGLPLAGSFKQVNTSDPLVKKALHNAVEQLNSNWTNNLYYWKVDKIYAAQEQIVVGTFYLIDFQIYKTECVKNEINLVSCLNADFKSINDTSATDCSVKVFNYLPTDGHGVNEYKVINSTCDVSEEFCN